MDALNMGLLLVAILAIVIAAVLIGLCKYVFSLVRDIERLEANVQTLINEYDERNGVIHSDIRPLPARRNRLSGRNDILGGQFR